jgi:magnesium transporter
VQSTPAAPRALPDLNTPVRDVARPDPVRLLKTETIAQALSRLRTSSIGERIIYFYITDEGGKLLGVVPTRRLILSDPSARVGDVMVNPVQSLSETEPLRDALETLVKRKLLALPVVDGDGRLTGVLDISTFAETLDPERRGAAEEVFQLAGIHIEQEKNRSLGWVLGNRFPWLLMNIGSGLAAAFISKIFDHTLKTVVATAFFIPLVLTLAESIAMQSVTMTLQGFHPSKQRRANQVNPALREMRVGLLLGLISGITVGLLGSAWLRLFRLAAVVAASILIAGAIGATFGYLVPRLIHRWKLDPKIASGPAVLALTDVAALFCYFALAAVFLS